MYYGSETAAHTAAIKPVTSHALGRLAGSRRTLQLRAADGKVVAAVLKVRRQIKNPTPSIDAYLLEEQSWQISSRSDLKRQSLRVFLKRRRRRKTTAR